VGRETLLSKAVVSTTVRLTLDRKSLISENNVFLVVERGGPSRCGAVWSKFKAELGDCPPRLATTRPPAHRTTHAEIGTLPEIGERLINHAAAVQSDVEAIYDRLRLRSISGPCSRRPMVAPTCLRRETITLSPNDSPGAGHHS
jgi:hypothetical protein